MKKTLYMLCFIALFIFSAGSFFALAAHADIKEDLSHLNGLWVVDYNQTEELWKTREEPEVARFQLIAAVYMLDMDFSTGTMVEGTSLSENPRRYPFLAGRDKDGNLLIFEVDTERGRTKTFLWKARSDDNMQVTVGETTLPIIMMKCDYSRYAGRWQLDIPANEALITILTEAAGDLKREAIEAKLADSYMTFSFSGGTFTMRWQIRDGQAIFRPFPSGEFDVSRYAKTDCSLEDDEILLTFKSDDYLVFLFREKEATMSLKRVAE